MLRALVPYKGAEGVTQPVQLLCTCIARMLTDTTSLFLHRARQMVCATADKPDNGVIVPMQIK